MASWLFLVESYCIFSFVHIFNSLNDIFYLSTFTSKTKVFVFIACPVQSPSIEDMQLFHGLICLLFFPVGCGHVAVDLRRSRLQWNHHSDPW